MLIDTHAHVNFNAYRDDTNEAIKRSLENNVWIINIGSQYTTSKRAVEIAEKYSEGVYAAVGLHPIHLETGLAKVKIDLEEIQFQTIEEEFDYEKYKELAGSKKVKAIGEIGLDYYYKPKTKTKIEQFKEKQKNIFLKQINLAKELNLPIIFHCRMAHNDLIEILRFQVSSFKFHGIIHCFTGTLEQAKKYLEMGFYLGFNGIIFKDIKGIDFKEIIKKIPLEKILLETDCPYLTPPLANSQRNEPLFIRYIAQEIAKIKDISFEQVAETTSKNAKKLFEI